MSQKITAREGWCPRCRSGPFKLETHDRVPKHGDCKGEGMLADSPRPSKNTHGKRKTDAA